MMQMSDGAKTVGDAVSIVTVVGTLAQILPALAAILTIIWTGIRIYETNTIQNLLGKKRIERKDDNA